MGIETRFDDGLVGCRPRGMPDVALLVVYIAYLCSSYSYSTPSARPAARSSAKTSYSWRLAIAHSHSCYILTNQTLPQSVLLLNRILRLPFVLNVVRRIGVCKESQLAHTEGRKVKTDSETHTHTDSRHAVREKEREKNESYRERDEEGTRRTQSTDSDVSWMRQ